MANTSLSKYNPREPHRVPIESRADIMRQNWAVMKPFVHFGFKAMILIGHALIGIIKLLPMLAPNRDGLPKKNTRIIKI